jgi:hypothetical protein
MESRSSKAWDVIAALGIWWMNTSDVPTSKTPPEIPGSRKIITGNPLLNKIPASNWFQVVGNATAELVFALGAAWLDSPWVDRTARSPR